METSMRDCLNTNDGIDRISDLPDDVLTHILSFVSTKEAVQTCILSKRWRDVWASVPILDFDDHKFWADGISDEEFMKQESKFVAFVSSVLQNRANLTLDSIKLKWWGKYSCTYPCLYGFLHFAAQCMPRILSIRAFTDSDFTLPDSIFTCASVEEMYLSVEIDDQLDRFIKQPQYIWLPSLRKLELDALKVNNNFMRMLLSGCAALEELVLDSCYLLVHEISSPVLKKLTLEDCCLLTEMQISCPSVSSLEIHSSNTNGITLENMSSLVTADITIEHAFFMDSFYVEMKLLGSLSNVTTLQLSTACPDVLDSVAADFLNCQALMNLKDLELGELDATRDWNLVASFLQHSPNLRKLALKFKQRSKMNTDSGEDPQGDVMFQHEYLETVAIKCPQGNDIFARDSYKEHKSYYILVSL